MTKIISSRQMLQRHLYAPTRCNEVGNWEYGYRYHVEGVGEERSFFYCHGNGGHAKMRLPLVGMFGPGTYYLHEYAGYGSRYGLDPLSESSLVGRARRAIESIESSSLYLIGESLGTGIVCALISSRVKGVVLLTPYTSLREVARRICCFAPFLFRDRYQTESYLRSASVRLLVVAGSHDRLFPPPMARRVAQAGKGTIVWYPGDHHDLYLDVRFWLPIVKTFLR